MHEQPNARAVAIVGVSAIMPDAPDAKKFWSNIVGGRYSISDVPPERWDPALYYDADPAVPDKTYSKIGGWVREFEWDPRAWRLPVPPKVSAAMDIAQQWGVNLARATLIDYGWPDRKLDHERTAVVIGNALAGEKHYQTALRISFPEFARELERSAAFSALPKATRAAIVDEARHGLRETIPAVTEDSMPGELANVIAGRIANLFDFRGPSYVTDAACASGLAAMAASIEGLINGEYDTVLTGGIDRNMGIAAYVKFCKIGALSATGTRPYGTGADGFVMGEGGNLFLLKRLADAERDGDRIYAVLLGMAGSSDGKGKGITAPNPVGQRLAVERAWRLAGEDPATCSLVEGHGTSTAVGDVVEVQALTEVFGSVPAGSIPLGSVKSNIGHLKGAAGTAGLFKAAMALHEKVLPATLHAEVPNPNIDFAHGPFRPNTEIREWAAPAAGIRRAGVSAFGFGGTNFHAVLEEYVPGRHRDPERKSVSFAGADLPAKSEPARGAFVAGAADERGITDRLRQVVAGEAPPAGPPSAADLAAPVRIAIDYGDAAELAAKASRALQAFEKPAMWKALRAQGIFLGRGPRGKIAFLYTGQGSQYVNMLRTLAAREPVVAETFAQADEVMTPLLGKPLTEYLFADGADAVARAEQQLLQTEITQPAVLAADLALTRLLATHNVRPDLAMGHSLGEYGALVAAGALSFADALEAVSARGNEMAHLAIEDNGAMAAVFAPLEEIERTVAGIDGYVVIANVNSTSQAVIGGATTAVEAAVAAFTAAGRTAVRLPVSHAFHTSIVAPVSEPLGRMLRRLDLKVPALPVVANVDGELYPTGPDARERMLDILERQVASPVQFVKGLETLYAEGARVFVEVGPKKALHGFVEDALGSRHDDVLALFTNHPKQGDLVSFNQALCGLYAAGFGAAEAAAPAPVEPRTDTVTPDRYTELGHLVADFFTRGQAVLGGVAAPAPAPVPAETEPVVITGAALGLPGTERVFDDANVGRILHGEQFIGAIPQALRDAMADKHITRLVKSENGSPRFTAIDSPDDVIKLAARAGALDLVDEFGVDAERDKALGECTRLAIGAGFDALRDAGIPLAQHYKTTTVGTRLADRWGLPAALRDDTGVIFASAFPGLGEFAEDVERYLADRHRRHERDTLKAIRVRAEGDVAADLDRRIGELDAAIAAEPFEFDRRFLFRVLSMGHSQFAEIIGARGPNTQVNSACASTTQAIGLAEDWIRAGRCRRVVIVAADDATSDSLLEWVGAGFLASGAAATDAAVEDAAVPFDARRHGMLLGMGAAGIVVEAASAARERGLRPICEVLAGVSANSAFHGTKLDVEHISGVMESLVSQAERRGIDRHAVASEMVFVSHETYTPARGGSAQAEIDALRAVFGPDADRVIIANTKGFTGHPMGVGIEDVVAVKALETGIVPPVPNFKEVDPSLGRLNLSGGGAYPVRYALRLAAGFGSQISMVLLRWTPVADGRHRAPAELGYGYRIADRAAWQRWLTDLGGTELEVDHRRLRIADHPAERRPAPEPEPVEIAEPEPAGDDITAQVVAVVAEKTGYPEDMLELDLDLEADLGVDTVKQAEVFAEIRERFGIERDDTLRLRDYPTLNHVIGFVRERGNVPVAEPAPVGDDTTAQVLSVVAEKTGYPEDMLELDLDLEADLGVDTVKQAEVFAEIRERFGIERDDSLRLRDYPTLNHVIGFVRERSGVVPEPVVDDVAGQVVAVVAEKTGYPEDMLELDLDLEADLGVDTVKQAEVFAEIRERFGIERDDTLRLRDYPTLNHVIGFVRERSGVPAESDVDTVEAEVLAVVAGKTGYPEDMLELDLDLEADLGVDTVKQAEVFAQIRERFGIERDDTLKLRDYPTLAHVIGFVRERASTLKTVEESTVEEAPAESGAFPRRVPVATIRPPVGFCRSTGVELGEGQRVVVACDDGGAGAALAAKLADRGVDVLLVEGHPAAENLVARVADGPVHGVYWLPALDHEGPIEAMDLDAWREANRIRVKLLYATMRKLYDSEPFLVTGTRLGGRHGYDDAGAYAPLGGAVTGFAKAYGRERPDALVKAVDFGPGATNDQIADALIEETLTDPGALEIGRADGLRWSVTVEERPMTGEGMALGPDTVFVVTGAAGSIVSAITADLAQASGGTFHLLDLTPEPAEGDADVVRFTTDHDGLKADLITRLTAKGKRPTPVKVERELARYERLAAAQAAIDAVRDAGGQVHYHSVDLTDADAVARALEGVERVDVLLHAAGLDISHALPDKKPREYDLVFGVKADGWFTVRKALGDHPPGTTVVFSSVAGRFGNLGQTDYSAANDLLCKLTSATGGLAIDWTAWAGIGMATRGSIPKMMERAGIEMLPPEIGVPWIRRELTGGAHRGEVVVAGELGALVGERDGIEPARFPAGPMAGEVERMGVHTGLVVRTTLDPGVQPFLADHRIDGTPVLPGVLGIEAFAEVAAMPLPGWRPVAVEDVEFLAPCKFYRDEPRTLTVTAVFRADGDGLVADCALTGSRQLAGQAEPQVTTHFTGRVRLARTPVGDAVTTAAPPVPDGKGVRADAIYDVFFHGPAFQVLEQAWRAEAGPVGLYASDLPADHVPAEEPELVSPRLIELVFQTAGVWDIGRHGRFGLPRHVDRIVLHDAPEPRGRLEAVVTSEADGFGGRVLDETGAVLLELSGYRTTELPGALDVERSAPMTEAMS
ncbi:acyl transferase domain-containing protein/acyl carrier protein [Amycolatopsis lexingtonensis]|uniref:Acyl transferase domain-containing protein/acyl carrier protein n=1 Tax=Amycolatopsis lexingtonensis TaxID=218822 RepID=A0ABR9HXV3_9PSEU|nr:type I polyketide synthase [Amycolatopsis lexingtonensis]MBE1495760.1 acyl transferase domain-containing protein/acyl carrier protein [Amycolatopsis lexingtonensis]